MLLLEMADEVLDTVLSCISDAESLARAEQTCTRVRARIQSEDLLWRAHVLRRWGWLVFRPSPGTSWKFLLRRFQTHGTARFAVVGGAPADVVRPEGYARELLCQAAGAGGWADLGQLTDRRPAVRNLAHAALSTGQGRGGVGRSGGAHLHCEFYGKHNAKAP